MRDFILLVFRFNFCRWISLRDFFFLNFLILQIQIQGCEKKDRKRKICLSSITTISLLDTVVKNSDVKIGGPQRQNVGLVPTIHHVRRDSSSLVRSKRIQIGTSFLGFRLRKFQLTPYPIQKKDRKRKICLRSVCGSILTSFMPWIEFKKDINRVRSTLIQVTQAHLQPD